MVLTTGALGLSVSPFTALFIGPVRPPTSDCTSPIVTSPPLEEDISEPPALPLTISIPPSPQVKMQAFQQFKFEQLRETDLILARSNSAYHPVPGLHSLYSSDGICDLLVDHGLPGTYLASMDAIGDLLSNFVQPALVHHQLLMGAHDCQLADLMAVARNNYDQFTAFCGWTQELFSLLSVNQENSIALQTYLRSFVDSLRTSLPAYVRDRLQAYDLNHSEWRQVIESSINTQNAGVTDLIDQLNAFRNHVNSQFSLVDAAYSCLSQEISDTITANHASTVASMEALRIQVAQALSPASPPIPTDPSPELKEIWEAIHELKAVTRSQAKLAAQAPPTPAPESDPQLIKLTTQLAKLRAELNNILLHLFFLCWCLSSPF